MSETNDKMPADGIEKISGQLDDICRRVMIVENFLKDLSPGFGKISKEITSTLNTLREKYERDETLILIEKMGDQIPTFIEVLDLMQGLKGFLNDFLPAMERINREVMPTVNALRTSLEKEETVELIIKAGDNLRAFHTLMELISLPETGSLLQGLGKGIEESIRHLEKEIPESGLRNLISLLGDAETHKALLFMVLFARNIYGGLTEE